MSLPIYQRVAVTDAGDVIPGAEYTVINENTGVAAPIYSDRTGATLLTAPYFADSVGTIQFFIAQGTTFRVAASGGVGTYTDRYVYGVAEAVLVDATGNVVGDISLGDNDKLILGTGSDLQIYHDGSNSYIKDAGTGDLILNVNNFRLKNAADSEIYLYAQDGVGVNLYHTGNAIKLATTSTGIDVTGTVTADGLVVDAGAYGTLLTAGGPNGYISVSNPSDNLVTAFTGTSDALALGTSNTERVRIDTSGNLLVGKTSADGADINVVGNVLKATGANYFTALSSFSIFNRLTTDGDILDFRKDGTTVGSIGVNSGTYPYIGGNTGGSGDVFLVFISNTTQSIRPSTSNGSSRDDAINLGATNARFNDIYATNGAIQTSDRNEKQDIEEITAAEHSVAKACKGLLRSFRWKSAVEKKGDDARIHFGIIAQDLQDAFTAEGLDAGRYAMFMSDTWWETQTEVEAVEAVEGVEFVQAVEASEALYSEDGELVSEAVEAVDNVEGIEAVEAKDAYTRTDTFETLAEAPAGATERTRLGVRYSELLAFIIAAL